MKRSILVICLVISAVLANPLPSEEEDWQLIPDTDGQLHLVDINAVPADEEIEPAFNAANDVNFLLFTQSNPNVGQRIALNNAGQLAGSNFNAAHPVRFIIHGWQGGAGSGVNNVNRAAYLSRGNFNVFVVDWGAGAQTNNYLAARDRVDAVGLVTGQFVDFLNLHGTPFAAVTIIGHSLGAHIAGIAGKRVTRGTVNTVVAMDPAFPLFSINDPGRRVHHTDAVYVEIQHTDIGRLGFDQPIGDASFYPNWGRQMPGCGADLAGQCSHSLVWEFMAESIRTPTAFFGTRCSGWAAIQNRSCPSTGPSMAMGGEPANNGANGVFFLETNANAPRGQGWRA